MKKNLSAAPFTVLCSVFLLIAACSKNDGITPTQLSEGYQQDQTETEEELLRKGWKLVKTIKLNPGGVPNALATASGTGPASNTSAKGQTFPLDLGHLKDIGYDVSQPDERLSLKKAFAKDGVIADGILFGPGVSVDANLDNYAGSEPNASITLGVPKLTSKKEEGIPDIKVSSTVTNDSDTEVKKTIKLTYKTGYKTSWSKKTSGTFKFGLQSGAKIPLLLEAKISMDITVGGESSNGEETSNEMSTEDDTEVVVPPHSKVTITGFVEVSSTTVLYEVPYSLTGSVRINYPEPTGGHYFWAPEINSVPGFKPNIVSEIGEAKAIKYVGFKTYISNPEKL